MILHKERVYFKCQNNSSKIVLVCVKHKISNLILIRRHQTQDITISLCIILSYPLYLIQYIRSYIPSVALIEIKINNKVT